MCVELVCIWLTQPHGSSAPLRTSALQGNAESVRLPKPQERVSSPSSPPSSDFSCPVLSSPLPSFISPLLPPPSFSFLPLISHLNHLKSKSLYSSSSPQWGSSRISPSNLSSKPLPEHKYTGALGFISARLKISNPSQGPQAPLQAFSLWKVSEAPMSGGDKPSGLQLP